ncbi:unnamed protein product [Blepharisma stoltei]|uniref:WWE domain-containing protein n=1 Tax=Blepharisma stoltei TaxID=1481888 RepID=A0AAU9JFA8_9CILI|nr:unnamed protein product [Blepharisma stoltei]
MRCYFCNTETEDFCICESESSVVCEKHAFRHVNENPSAWHFFEKIYYYPTYPEKVKLFNNIKIKISTLETIKANKIKENDQVIKDILKKLKNEVEIIDGDISNLNYFLKQLTVPCISNIEHAKIVSLFNSSYENIIKFLEDNGWLRLQNFISKISPTYKNSETQAINSDQRPLCDLSYPFTVGPAPKIQAQINNDFPVYRGAQMPLPKLNAVWSKLTEEGTFVPYNQADNEIIENAYHKKDPFASIGGDGNQCFVKLTSPILEIQEVRSLITKVLRNNSPEIFDSKAILESWYYKSDKGWRVMTPDASRMAEYAHRKQYKEALVQGENKKSYRLDLINMKQINPKTNYKRDIRRGNIPSKAEEETKSDNGLNALPIALASQKSPLPTKRG